MASVVLGFSLSSKEESSFFFRKNLVCGAEIFRFKVGEIGESGEKDTMPDIYKNVKDQKKKIQIWIPVPFLKLKLKNSCVCSHLKWNAWKVTNNFQ